MAGAVPDTAPIPLQLDINYVDAAHDACFAWLKAKYATLLPTTATTTTTPTASDASLKDGKSKRSADHKPKTKKPQLDKSLLQRVENDIAACDTLRWRVFAFPSHPTQPLNSSYRNEPGKKDGPSTLTAQLHKVKKSALKEQADVPEAVKPSRYALVITTRASADAKKKEKKQQKKKAKADGIATTPPAPVKMEELMERLVREEEQAKRCRLLGEDNVVFGATASAATATPERASDTQAESWVRRCVRPSWRPLLGGYVSAPSRADSARFLLFPQSSHTAVDFRDPTVPQLPAGTTLADPQPVPFYLRGSVSLDVEKRNPAAAAATDPTAAEHHKSSATPAHGGTGLSYSIHAARHHPAPTSLQDRNWADVVDVSVAAQQSRTERQYAAEREKVQRVTLLEDTATVQLSQGDPRCHLSVTATHATLPNSGVQHQHEAAPSDTSAAAPKKAKKAKKTKLDKHASSLSSPLLSAVWDDSVDQLLVQDGYDSSVQYFGLPRFWQLLVRPSLKASEDDSTGETGTGTQVLETAPRGQYRVRLSGGPGVEVCRAGRPAQQPQEAVDESPSSLFTVFGKLWTESWVEVPLPWRLALKLRTQTAVTMPLEPSKPVWPPMVSNTPATVAPTQQEGEGEGAASRFREHPYFWATQGPRWDAALVRGFKNDYSGMHHARRWYSILSAELTLNGNAEKGSGKPVVASRGSPAESANGDDAFAETTDGATAGTVAPRPTTSSRWKSTSLTAFANACMVDTVKNYPRASVGFSFTSKLPRMAITPFNEIIPHKFECSFSWFAAFKPNSSSAGDNGRGFNVEFLSGVQQQQQQGGGAAVGPTAADGMPFLRVSPVETFQHMKCGLTWKFDE